jgi:hypothetical protein
MKDTRTDHNLSHCSSFLRSLASKWWHYFFSSLFEGGGPKKEKSFLFWHHIHFEMVPNLCLSSHPIPNSTSYANSGTFIYISERSSQPYLSVSSQPKYQGHYLKYQRASQPSLPDVTISGTLRAQHVETLFQPSSLYQSHRHNLIYLSHHNLNIRDTA